MPELTKCQILVHYIMCTILFFLMYSALSEYYTILTYSQLNVFPHKLFLLVIFTFSTLILSLKFNLILE